MFDSKRLTVDTANFISKIEKNSAKPLYEMTPEQARQVLRDVQDVPLKIEEAVVEDINLPVGGNKTIPVRIIRPHQHEGKNLPLVFYIHGGGWVMGDATTHDRLMREFAVGSGAAVVFPSYSPAPESKYPTQIYELFNALKYIVKEAENFNFDTQKVVLAGDSVGGNMATVLAMMAKENNSPKIAFQLLLYPVTNAAFETDSYHEFAEGPWLTRKAMQWFWDAYAPDDKSRKEMTVSPLLTEVVHLEGLPPALIITAENDVLRDEGEAYARKLIEAKVDVSCVRINNTIHDFMMLNSLALSKPTRTAVNLAITVLRRLFYHDRV